MKNKNDDFARFIELMAQMYLKYGANSVVTKELVMKLFPNTQCGKKK